MIPKIAHFHWTGGPMSWLRHVGIETFVKYNPEWEVRVLDTPAHIRKHELLYAHEADWTWLEAVYEHGGFALATDSVFVRPVPEVWTEKNGCVCTAGTKRIFHNLFGFPAGNPYVKACLDRCHELAKQEELGYQSFGPENMQVVWGELPPTGYYDMPLDALCPVRCDQIHLLWSPVPLVLPETAVGVHWYGGAEESRLKERDAPETAAIVKLAKEHM